jgi:competence ComEA-like helix-hairpin-helix protein
MFGLTPDEKRVIIFFVIVLALGNAVLLYKKWHPSFAPELKYMQNDLPKEVAVGENTATTRGPITPGSVNNLKKSFSGKIDINAAGQRDLEKLPSIGPAMAKRIIDYRQSTGGFRKPEDLMNVKGIGSKKYNKLREHVFVDH